MKLTEHKRIVREYRTSLEAKAEQIFPLLCPMREYDWIPYWQCDLIYSQSGVAEIGCVFKTNSGEDYGEEVWVVSHYEPNRRISFIRTGKERTTRYEITLVPGDGVTEITWYQEITGIDPQGDTLVEKYSEKEFRSLMVPLNKMLAHYLKTGEALLEE